MDMEVVTTLKLPALPLVEVDTNHSYFSPNKPTIDVAVVLEMGLLPGQSVVAYMPPDPLDVWPGVVGYDESLEPKWQWWVELGR